MFVAATLYAPGGSCPVNLRNMSLSGALVEGRALPDRDTPITLRRGSLEASARIVWRVGRRAGIAFSSTIHVADWMSRKPDPHQARVDDIVREIRLGSGRPVPTQGAAHAASLTGLAQGELKALREELLTLENGLMGDVIVVATHPEIQLLDVALQRVERMLKGASGS